MAQNAYTQQLIITENVNVILYDKRFNVISCPGGSVWWSYKNISVSHTEQREHKKHGIYDLSSHRSWLVEDWDQ